MFKRITQWFSSAGQRLAEIGAALTLPIERIFGGVAGKVLSATEQVDRVESVFLRLIGVVFWPLRFLGRLLLAIMPEPLVLVFAATGDTMRGFAHRLGMLFMRLAEILNLDRFVFWLIWLLQPVWRPVGSLFEFAYCWINTRQYRSALMALPAVILAALVLGVGVWQSVFGKSKIIANYRTAVRNSLEVHDYESAQFFEQKLAQLGFDTQMTAYRAAVTMDEEGKTDEAYRRMQLLAPEDEPGYPNAHFWQLQRLLAGKLVEDRSEALRLAGIHLNHLKALDIRGPSQQLLEAIWLVQKNQLGDAVAMLQPLIASMPSAAFESMRINLQLNRPEQAREAARALIGLMAAQQRRNAELGAQELQWWFAAEETLGNLQQMRIILEKWRVLEPENKQLKQALAQVHRRQAAQLLRAPLPDQTQIVEHWLAAAELDDDAASLLKLARAIYQGRKQNPLYENLLIAMRESPRSPVQLLLAVGTEAALAERYDDARSFFAAAVERDDTNPIAWNNYGLVLGEGEKPELEEALSAVNRALAIAPKEYRFRETRGQILVKLERWQEAIEDLEFALNGLPTLDAIHRSLAVAYMALGEEELAQLHQSQVE